MGIQKVDADEIAQNAAELFRERGYYGTTMAQVADACGLLKGSLYHHFPGKEALAIDVLERTHSHFYENIFVITRHDAEDPKVTWEAMLQAIEDYFLETRGCLMAAIGLEVSNDEPRFRSLIQHFFAEWVEVFSDLLAPIYGRKKAITQAQDLVIQIEGAVMWLHICDDPAPLKRIRKAAVALM